MNRQTGDSLRPGKGEADQPSMAAQPLLPYARSFLVQFTADTDPRLSRAAGRVEHLQTGRQSRFASLAALRACIATVLGSDDPPAAGPLRSEAPGVDGTRPRRAKAAPRKGAVRRRRTRAKRR